MREHIEFDGRTAMVAGGASGIGKVIATEFAVEGADVVVADIDAETGEETAADVADEHGVGTRFVETDVSDYDSCVDAVSGAVDAFGSLDVLVNTAAITGKAISKPFLKEDPSDWEPQWEVTMKGTVNTTHAALLHMTENGGGAVVNTVSDSYQGHDPNFTIYGAAKAAIATFTKSVAKEVGRHDVRVNAISPGTTRVPRSADFIDAHYETIVENYPLGRLGEPADHANAAVFLASDAADWITGQVLSVNGGYL